VVTVAVTTITTSNSGDCNSSHYLLMILLVMKDHLEAWPNFEINLEPVWVVFAFVGRRSQSMSRRIQHSRLATRWLDLTFCAKYRNEKHLNRFIQTDCLNEPPKAATIRLHVGYELLSNKEWLSSCWVLSKRKKIQQFPEHTINGDGHHF